MSTRNDVQNEPLCPDCGELLKLVDCDELDYNFFDYAKQCYGVCPKCNKTFCWMEVYEYKGVTGIKEVPPDEDEYELDAYNRNPDMMALNS